MKTPRDVFVVRKHVLDSAVSCMIGLSGDHLVTIEAWAPTDGFVVNGGVERKF